MLCDECSGRINEIGYCSICGLESPDFNEREFDHSVRSGSKSMGAHESRERKARKVRQYGKSYGFTCILCLEMFKESSRTEADATVLDLEAKMRGFEQIGTDLARFNRRNELEFHIELAHGGRKEYWRRVNERKRMASVRLISKNPVSTFQKGSK